MIMRTLNAKVLLQHRRVCVQRFRGTLKYHIALNQNDVAVGDLGNMFPIFVHNDRADAAVLDDAANAPDLASNQWCQAFGGFVEDKHIGVGHQCATNGEHLLLTP